MGTLPEVDGLLFGIPDPGPRGGTLLPYCLDFLRLRRPLWFLAEYGRAPRNSDERRLLSQRLDILRNAGYALTPHFFRFEEYGLAQRRHRIVLVGIRSDLGLKFVPPAPWSGPVTADAALKGVPAGEIVDICAKPRTPGKAVLDPQMPADDLSVFANEPSALRHWKKDRELTIRELARLQSFPDSFDLSGSPEEIRSLVIEAFPPAMAAILLEALIKTFLRIGYGAVEADVRGEEE